MKNAFQLFSEQKNKLFTIKLFNCTLGVRLRKTEIKISLKKKKKDVVGY